MKHVFQLQKVIDTEIVFIITLHEVTEEAVVHVLGKKYLEPPVRLGISSETLTHIKERGLEQNDDIEMDAHLMRVIRVVLEQEDLSKVYTVSIVPKSHKCKIDEVPSTIIYTM